MPGRCVTCTTIVRSFGLSCCGFFGGCGTNASKPFGVTGTMTIKMIKSTSRTSIRGVTLMSDESPPGPLPLPIAIAISSFPCPLFSGLIGRLEADPGFDVFQLTDRPSRLRQCGRYRLHRKQLHNVHERRPARRSVYWSYSLTCLRPCFQD